MMSDTVIILLLLCLCIWLSLEVIHRAALRYYQRKAEIAELMRHCQEVPKVKER